MFLTDKYSFKLLEEAKFCIVIINENVNAKAF